jgi:hypothetical protein
LNLEDGNRKDSHEEAAAMEMSLDATPAILPEHRLMGHYDLAKFWVRQGDASAQSHHDRSAE